MFEFRNSRSLPAFASSTHRCRFEPLSRLTVTMFVGYGECQGTRYPLMQAQELAQKSVNIAKSCRKVVRLLRPKQGLEIAPREASRRVIRCSAFYQIHWSMEPLRIISG